jgi:outer membrane protein assembly factor BamB
VPATRLRRPPLRVVIWTAGALVLVVVIGLLWRISDARATSSTTAPAPAPVTGSPGGALSQAWSASGTPMPEQAVASGRVVVGSRHGITALDPATGHEVWHYTRSNARLCGLTATDGLAVAVWAKGASLCDQAVALEADTGVRAWNRNVDFRPDVRLTSTTGHVLAVAPTGVVDLDPTGDNIRWRYSAPSGCLLADAVAGSSGMALLQRCSGTSTLQVRLLDALSGEPHWTREVPDPDGSTAHLAGADALVTLVLGDQLQVLAAADGAQQQALALPSGAAGIPSEIAAGGAVLVWTHGTVLSLDRGSGALRWQGPARGLPGVQLGTRSQSLGSEVTVPEDGGFVVRNPGTGEETARSTAADLPTGGRTEVIGGTVVYRLPSRVLGYRSRG